ncbi:PucR family transcriptional regulator [Nocardia panacis]|uniref:PucR family transcriptional regulator n=1 Tax=Nocardia panacis TaxID=2340916 RepID=A0A3A4K579_9NOCA|nr:PucR family transcriptional regulator ligand-binding domain-containing protein [Nocardia panacis]RJO73631.1 PucR family transcriptional regulator [Nocardia panacis]
MRLRSLLTMPELGLELVTGEDELDRFVRWVVVTDMLDPSRYLSGGELVVTGLYWHREPADSEIFVAAVARAGAAALATGDARYGGAPPDIVAACRRYRLPLFRVPENIAFAQVTERITRRLSTGRAADLTAVLDRHRQLVAGDGLGPVLDLIERDLGMRCWVLSTTGRLVAGRAEPPPGVTAAFLAADRLPRLIAGDEPLSLFAVDEHATSRAADWLLVFEGDHRYWPEERRALAAELAAVAALERARHDDRQHTSGRLAQELIQLIVSDAAPAEVRSRLELTGASTGERYLAVAADATPLRPGEVRMLVREILFGRDPAVGVVESEVIALVATHRADAVVHEIRTAVAALTAGLRGGRLSVGVSGVVDPDGVRGAVEEARYARRMAAARPEPACVVEHGELGTHMLLLASVPDEVRHMFRLRLLDPLTTYDQDNRADLVHTLESFLQVSGSWTKCAELLHVHVNTLRYRVQRIEELTGRDLSRLADRVDFFLALALR